MSAQVLKMSDLASGELPIIFFRKIRLDSCGSNNIFVTGATGPAAETTLGCLGVFTSSKVSFSPTVPTCILLKRLVNGILQTGL